MTCEEALVAVFASKSLDPAVDLQVLPQVALLLEGLVAFTALEGPVVSVGQHVVDECMPVAEDLVAVLRLAREHSEYPSVYLWNHVLHNDVVAVVRDELLQPQTVHVKVLSLLNQEQGVLAEPLFVLYFDL